MEWVTVSNRSGKLRAMSNLLRSKPSISPRSFFVVSNGTDFIVERTIKYFHPEGKKLLFDREDVQRKQCLFLGDIIRFVFPNKAINGQYQAPQVSLDVLHDVLAYIVQNCKSNLDIHLASIQRSIDQDDGVPDIWTDEEELVYSYLSERRTKVSGKTNDSSKHT
jgi:hypothetical protein